MTISRILILLLLMSFIGSAGCTPITETELITVDQVDASNEFENPSTLEVNLDSVQAWLDEGGQIEIPINVRNASSISTNFSQNHSHHSRTSFL